MTINNLKDVCDQNGLSLKPVEVGLLEEYASRLLNWNSKINLISRKDEAAIFSRHILHSLTLRMPAIFDYDFSGKRALDLGTGGGLPGIPLKIVTTHLDMTLVDSIQKKIEACTSIISELGLRGIRTIAGRAEELARVPEHARQYDVIVSRAVAPIEDLVKWLKGLLKPAGVLLSLKGGDLSEEIRQAGRLKLVRSIEVHPLAVKGYPEYVREEKKLIRVEFR